MNNVGKGVIAGFVATTILLMLMLMKSAMGPMPELDVITMLGGMMGSGPAMGWIAHFLIGSAVWGSLFALLSPHLQGGGFWLKGVILSIAPWLLMMIAVMPMTESGFFGIALGTVIPVMTLMLHAFFGAVLGGAYAMLQSSGRDRQPAHS